MLGMWESARPYNFMFMVMTSEAFSFDFDFDNKPTNKPMVIVPFPSKHGEWNKLEGIGDVHNKKHAREVPALRSLDLRIASVCFCSAPVRAVTNLRRSFLKCLARLMNFKKRLDHWRRLLSAYAPGGDNSAVVIRCAG